MPVNVIAVRCSFCSKQLPAHRCHRLGSNQVICDRCLDWHLHAIDFLGGEPPRGCFECEATWEHLRDSTPGVEVRMYVVPKDGIQQLLCRGCVAKYLPKRAEMFKGTEFGRHVLNL